MSKIACVMTDMFEDSEYTSPVQEFEGGGHEVMVIGPEAGKEVTGKNGEAKVKTDLAIEDAKPEDYDALFIPGGFSPDILRADDRFVHFARHFMDQDKPVFAICHGPQLLITADVLKDRKVTGFKSIHMDLKHAGADFQDKEVVVCHNLVTSRTPDDLPAFNRESLKLLK
ncbi:protease [Alteribacter lacisalsi]|uniref:Protease n=1 Tax=Alteribacter lacisalsi TaxID=2045244 RepID=A0A2W0HP19_9BACI|nr:type 1 glutamine amidotransferase domain-containing protein [Alteribacter lacisalsi]PYZ98832.1 protease [Alteribacter lacisalsi]